MSDVPPKLKKDDNLIEDAICLNCDSLFKDTDNTYRCFARSDKTYSGNELIFGIKKKLLINKLDQHCSLFSVAKKKLNINQIAIHKKLEKELKKDEDENTRFTSCHINEDKKLMYEQVSNKEEMFCFYDPNNDKINYVKELFNGGKTYKPLIGEEIEKKAILLPTKAEEYGSDEELDKELKKFITKWLDIPKDVLQFAIWNIKRSWVYERFHTLNYLRALGDTGQGKSRFLDVLGSIHYKPIATSGATTAAPVFRIIDKWKGTLIMDEADFKNSDESQDIIKIINQGYERGKFIMRCDKDNLNKVNFFDPFCPKILATRKTFYDKAVESRCITQVMTGTLRKDIPVNLNANFFETAATLRNKLLTWRLKNYFKIEPDIESEFDLGDLEPRVRQIVNSFISLFKADTKQLEQFKRFIERYQEDLIDERKSSFTGVVVEGIYELLLSGVRDITAKDIIKIKNITKKDGSLSKPRSLSSTLKSLGFGKSLMKREGGKVQRLLPMELNHLQNLFKRYGFDCNDVTVVTVLRGIGANISDNKPLDEKQKKIKVCGDHRDSYNRYNVTDDSEPITESEPIKQTIHATCISCGTSPCDYYTDQGKPMCEICYNQKKAQKEVIKQ